MSWASAITSTCWVSGADRETDRNGGSFVYIQDDALLNIGLKALGLDLQVVVTDRQFQQDISAGRSVMAVRVRPVSV